MPLISGEAQNIICYILGVKGRSFHFIRVKARSVESDHRVEIVDMKRIRNGSSFSS
ncbi:MAG: hypothetical protein SRB2_02842 [Desulfobacteraceae bacterium Eth-SRB2]|nr:MAG: hypothetical protein SRB2_02842 [Desulfobacteraceae bacterium Eth-SRB2]